MSPEIAARIEREVMGDTMEGILERQEGIAREHYRKVLELGWKDKKLDVLRRIPSGRLAMLLENRELFRERDFADIPVSAAERKELPGELPWATFVVAIRVATDLTLTSDVVTNRLRALADELGLSEEQAVAIEHEVLGLVEAVVSPGSGGRFRTIGQALRKVRPGGRIRVRPGTYQESLVIDKPVDIVGEGPRQNIVIESTGAPCLTVSADKGTMKGLTLRRLSDPNEPGWEYRTAITITTGQVTVNQLRN